MNKTLVILGNGFDLDLGWKTSYNDFYLSKKQRFNEINGMSYIQEMISEGHWNNLEGYLRNCVASLSRERIEEIKSFWQVCVFFIYDYLVDSNNKNNIYTTNKNSCAYYFLEKLNSSQIFTFNYTNPFSKNCLAEKEMLYIHEQLTTYPPNIRLGIDSDIIKINELSGNDDIKHIIKSNENNNINIFHGSLKKSENIIIYGHSFGITDSDYFKPFFKAIIDGKLMNKNIYIVTYNDKSLQDIKDNMLLYGIDYSELVFSKNVEINTIFTSKGKDDEAFLNMLSNVSL